VTSPGSDAANSSVARACADKLAFASMRGARADAVVCLQAAAVGYAGFAR
jgi:hypothetical protein